MLSKQHKLLVSFVWHKITLQHWRQIFSSRCNEVLFMMPIRCKYVFFLLPFILKTISFWCLDYCLISLIIRLYTSINMTALYSVLFFSFLLSFFFFSFQWVGEKLETWCLMDCLPPPGAVYFRAVNCIFLHATCALHNPATYGECKSTGTAYVLWFSYFDLREKQCPCVWRVQKTP